MVSEQRVAQSAVLQSIVRSGESVERQSKPTTDSVPERNAQRQAEKRVAYQQQVQRVANIRKSTVPQRNYIVVLLSKLKDHNPEVWQQASEWWNRMDSASEPSPIPFALADKTIKRLLHHLDQPASITLDPYDDIPNGRYATMVFRGTNGGEAKLHFYRVSRWRTSEKVDLQEQAGDTLYWVSDQKTKTVLDAIRKDPRAAAELYASELGKCYRCGRTLTDADSRSKGIGPDCETKVKW